MKHIFIITVTGKSLVDNSLILIYELFRQLFNIPFLIG